MPIFPACNVMLQSYTFISLYLHTVNTSSRSNPDGCPKEIRSVCGNVRPVTWPETEIGEVASVSCPCGLDDPLIQQLKGTRRCGGTYEGGARWEEPQCNSCSFTETRRELCALDQVGYESYFTGFKEI